MLLKFADFLAYSFLGLSANSRLGAMAQFFIYDSVKILLLLFGLIFVIGVLRTWLPAAQVKRWAAHQGILPYFYSALFGAVTPFCSCSSIPVFIGFLKAGVPLGVGFAFLITSPLVNEYLVVLMLGFFGWKITALYVLSGLALGVGSGWALGHMKLEKYLVSDFLGSAENGENSDRAFVSWKERLKFGYAEAVSIVQKIWLWVLLGVGLGAFIHNYIPQETIHSVMNKAGVFSVPIATLIGVPLYGGCASIVPVVVVLFQKGVPLGTALALLMSISALSLPEAILLRRAMKLQLIAIFFAVTASAIILIGYAFNWVEKILG